MRPRVVRLSVWMAMTCLLVLVPLIGFSTWVLYRSDVEQQRAATQVLGRRAGNAAAAIARELDSICTELGAISVADAAGLHEAHSPRKVAENILQADRRLRSVAIRGPDGIDTTAARRGLEADPAAARQPPGEAPAGPHCQTSQYIAPDGALPSLVRIAQQVPSAPSASSLSATIDLKTLGGRFDDLHWPAEWTAAIIDRDGLILARSHDAARYVGAPATPALMQALANGAKTFRSVTKDGTAVVTQAAPIAGTAWHVVVGLPASLLDAQVRAAMAEMFAAAAACIALGIAAAVGSARFIVRQLRQVVDLHVRGDVEQALQSPIQEIRQISDALEAARASMSRAFTEVEAARESALTQLRERDEMLDVLAHEVRQPLNNASAALQEARAYIAGSVTPEAAAPLSRANGVLSEVTSSIDNTLAAASLLVGETRLHRIDFDVDTLIGLASADLATDHRSRIRVERASSTRTAYMDPGLMRLALRNLMSNAVKFSPREAPVTIRISDSDQPLAVVLDVIDSGPGIPPEMLPMLFKRGGRRLASIGGRRHGLGLYIVRRVMQLHGGSATLEHNGADGTTFRLTLNQGFDD